MNIDFEIFQNFPYFFHNKQLLCYINNFNFNQANKMRNKSPSVNIIKNYK